MYRTTLRRTILKKRKFAEEIQRQNKESYFTFKYPFIENCIVYEIMWRNVVEPNTEYDYIIQHMRFCILLDKAMYTQSKYNLLLFHVKNIYTTVPQYHDCKNNACFFSFSLCK